MTCCMSVSKVLKILPHCYGLIANTVLSFGCVQINRLDCLADMSTSCSMGV